MILQILLVARERREIGVDPIAFRSNIILQLRTKS